MRAANFFSLKIILALALVQALYLPVAFSQEFWLSGNRKKSAIYFDLIKNLVIVPLYINDKGPYNFILDTGVGPLVVTDPSIIEDLGLKNLRAVKISGLGKGIEIDAYLSNDISVKLGRASIERIPTAILKEDILSLSNHLGTKIYGLLGYYFFNSFIVELKYSSKRMIFYLPETKKQFKGEKIPIEIINNKPHATIRLKTSNLGTIDVKVIIDNGASHAISLETLHEKPFPVPDQAIAANLGIGLSGPISGSIGRVPELKIGSFTLENVISAYPTYDDLVAKTYLLNRNGNLGADILTRFNIIFDYHNDAMYLRKNSSFKLPFEHDMSGIEVYVDGTDQKRYFINRVEPGSPGEEAGLQPNDEILSLNFQPAKSQSLNDISKLFRSSDGKFIFLTINRNGSFLVRTIKLKKRI